MAASPGSSTRILPKAVLADPLCTVTARMTFPCLRSSFTRAVFDIGRATRSLTMKMPSSEPCLLPRPTVRVRGPHGGKDPVEHLQTQLDKISKDVQKLTVGEDTPSNAEWDLLGSHFTSIKDIHLDAGFNEEWNDERFPLHWPLERLVISSSISDVCRSPWILEGRVRHLVLAWTMGLRFEGPTSDELYKANNRKIERGEKEENYIGGGIKVTYFPELVHEWMAQKYGGTNQQQCFQIEVEPTELESAGPQARLEILEILENDAHDTLLRYTLALGGLLGIVKTLNIRSTNGCDLHLSEDILEEILPQLVNMETLILTIGDFYRDRDQLPRLYRYLPPNIKTLRLRSSVSLVGNAEVWVKWIEAFRNPDFLPNLKKLSLVLDLKDGEERRLENERRSREWEVTGAMEKKEAQNRSTETESGVRKEPETENASDVVRAEDPRASQYPKDDASGDKELPDGQSVANGLSKLANRALSPQLLEVKANDASAMIESHLKDQSSPMSRDPVPGKPENDGGKSEVQAVNENRVPEDTLRRAKRACEKLWKAAEERGVKIEPFVDGWVEHFPNGLQQVDERWEKL